jgi:hypothetical protein
MDTQGDPQNMAQAIYIISSAVDRYKELCEGRYKGEASCGCHYTWCMVWAAMMQIVVYAAWVVHVVHVQHSWNGTWVTFDRIVCHRHWFGKPTAARVSPPCFCQPTQPLAYSPHPPTRPTPTGQAVSRGQQVLGVEFFYQPPPKSVVPSAASLRGTHPLTYK